MTKEWAWSDPVVLFWLAILSYAILEGIRGIILAWRCPKESSSVRQTQPALLDYYKLL